MEFPTASAQKIVSLHHYQPFVPAHARGLLVEHRLHFSDPRLFNDPWDCKPFFRVDHLSDPKEQEKMVAWYKEITQRRMPGIPAQEIERRAAFFAERPELLVQKVREFTRVMATGIGEQYRVYCLTPHADSELMWAHYAKSHTGICLEFDAAHPLISVAQRVGYSEDYPRYEMTPSESLEEVVAPLFRKSAAWRYEEEYRLVSQERARSIGDTILTDDGFCPLPEGALKAVIFGCLVDDATHREAREMIGEGGRGIALKQMMRAPDKYQLVTVAEYPFPADPAAGGYRLFPRNLEDDGNVFFHATHAGNFKSIMEHGFKIPDATAENPVPAVSFAKGSNWSLTWGMGKRDAEQPGDWVVLAVRYEDLARNGLQMENIDIHDRTLFPPPEIIGYCWVPTTYKHK